MRFYVQHYNLVASNTVERVREMGSPEVVGTLLGVRDFQIHCDLIPVLDQGESTQDILNKLAIWLDGTEINMVLAQANRPRCFFCGTINDSGKSKCPQCGGEMGYENNKSARMARRNQ